MFDKISFKTALDKYGLLNPSMWTTERIVRELPDCFGGEGNETDQPFLNIINVLFRGGELPNLVTHEDEDDFIRIATKVSNEFLVDINTLWQFMNMVSYAVCGKEYIYDDLIEQNVSQAKTSLEDYDISGDTIRRYLGSDLSITLPDSYEGKRIRKIADKAFMNKGLTTVVIPDGIVEIGESAFSNNLISSLTIPDSITLMKSHAFSENRLEEVMIPKRLKDLPSYCFARNELVRVHFSDAVEEISTGCFYKNNLTALTLPTKLKLIGVNAFENNFIDTIDFSDKIQTISNWAFKNNRIQNLSIPNSIKHIGLYAFSENNIKEVTGSKQTLAMLDANDCIDFEYQKIVK